MDRKKENRHHFNLKWNRTTNQCTQKNIRIFIEKGRKTGKAEIEKNTKKLNADIQLEIKIIDPTAKVKQFCYRNRYKSIISNY